MAPKSSAGKEKLVNDEDEVLQAVLLADSFDSRFKPLTTGKPRVCVDQRCSVVVCGWAEMDSCVVFVTDLQCAIT